VISLALKLLIGAALGALLGYFGQCSSGTCPLTANWKRGALYGAALGLLFHFASSGTSGSHQAPKNVKPIAEADFDAEVLRAGKPVVVDFFATWCGPCKTLAPRLDTLAGEFGDRIKFVSVNVDQAQTLATKYGVQGIPTLLFFGPDGKVADTTVGLVSADALRAKLEALASQSATRPSA
jgi:thioredoxin 1